MIRVRPSNNRPGDVYIETDRPCHYRTPRAARALAARIVKVAAKVDRKKKGKAK